MIRPCVLHLHRFPIEQFLLTHSSLLHRAIALHDEKGVLIACSVEAEALGLRPGLTVKQATSREQRLGLFPVPVDLEEAFLQVATRLFSFSPLVAVWHPFEVVVDLDQSQHLYKGEVPLVRAMAGALSDLGFSLRIAIADSLAAARLATRGTGRGEGIVWLERGNEEAFIQGFPLVNLDALPGLELPAHSLRLLQHLGLSTLGDLGRSRQPLSGVLPKELQQELFLYARRSPLLHRQLQFLEEPVLLERVIPFFPPVDEVTPLLFHLREALAELSRVLEQRGLVVARLDLHFLTESLEESHRFITLSTPSRNPETLLSLCRVPLESLQIQRPLAFCRVTVTHAVAQNLPRTGLFEDSSHQPSALPHLLNRLESMLGDQALFRLKPVPAVLPEKRFRPVSSLERGFSQEKREEPASASGIYRRLGISPNLSLPLACPFPALWTLWGEQRGDPLSSCSSPTADSPPIPAYRLEYYDSHLHRLVNVRYFRKSRVGLAPLVLRKIDEDPLELVGIED